MPPQRRGTSKGPTDLTGREDERLKAVNAEALDQAAQNMAMATTKARKASKAVVDYTDESRPKPSATPLVSKDEAPKGPRIVRILADIENMTFGKEIISPGDFTDPNNPKMPVLGALKYYDFQEGREYKVDYPMYVHLRDLGYIHDYDDEDYEE